MANAPLSEKEQVVYKYIKKHIDKNGYSPTYRQIQEGLGYQSIGAVQRFLKQLSTKGYIQVGEGQRRGISLLEEESAEATRLPLLGKVAAGLPIEAVETMEFIDVAKSMVKPGHQFFALQVKGDSMIDDHIVDGDYVIIKKQKNANEGEIVVALIDNEATLKRFRKRKDVIELHPANKNYQPIKVRDNSNFEILGVLTGVIRKY
jgi:repressor LexA